MSLTQLITNWTTATPTMRLQTSLDLELLLAFYYAIKLLLEVNCSTGDGFLLILITHASLISPRQLAQRKPRNFTKRIFMFGSVRLPGLAKIDKLHVFVARPWDMFRTVTDSTDSAWNTRNKRTPNDWGNVSISNHNHSNRTKSLKITLLSCLWLSFYAFFACINDHERTKKV